MINETEIAIAHINRRLEESQKLSPTNEPIRN